jgi:PQQ-like domain
MICNRSVSAASAAVVALLVAAGVQPLPAAPSAAAPAPATAPAAAAGAPAGAAAPAGDQAGEPAVRVMYGGTPSRNMVSNATHLPSRWDPATGLNVKWTANLGSQSYGGPLVAGGRVYVGTNNQEPRDPKTVGDRGVLMAFRAADGHFLWQAVHEKLSQGKVNDWPLQGICSTPAVDGDSLYYVSNRAELVCARTAGREAGADFA